MDDGRIDYARIRFGRIVEVADSTKSSIQWVVNMFDFKWSHTEKIVARRAFDLALRNELQATINEAKRRAAKIEEPSELWELEEWLAERRLDVNRRYDYRYSVLPVVLAHLVRDGHLKEIDLEGLQPENLEYIRRGSIL